MLLFNDRGRGYLKGVYTQPFHPDVYFRQSHCAQQQEDKPILAGVVFIKTCYCSPLM